MGFRNFLTTSLNGMRHLVVTRVEGILGVVLVLLLLAVWGLFPQIIISSHPESDYRSIDTYTKEWDNGDWFYITAVRVCPDSLDNPHLSTLDRDWLLDLAGQYTVFLIEVQVRGLTVAVDFHAARNAVLIDDLGYEHVCRNLEVGARTEDERLQELVSRFDDTIVTAFEEEGNTIRGLLLFDQLNLGARHVTLVLPDIFDQQYVMINETCIMEFTFRD